MVGDLPLEVMIPSHNGSPSSPSRAPEEDGVPSTSSSGAAIVCFSCKETLTPAKLWEMCIKAGGAHDWRFRAAK